MACVSPFFHGPVVNNTAVVDDYDIMCICDPGAPVRWSYSLIIGIYPATSARRHDLIFHPYQNDIYTPVPGVSNPVENRSCPESTWCCDRSVITPSQWTIRLEPFRFRRMGHGRVVSTLDTAVSGQYVSLLSWIPWFKSDIQLKPPSHSGE